MNKAIIINALFSITFCCAPCFGQLDKWINNEVIPTVRGERPLKIKPYVRISHEGKEVFEFGQDRIFIRIGDVSIKTHQLRLRLLQAGCIIETGDVISCAPDIVERELLKIANDKISNGSTYNNKNPFYNCDSCLWKPKISFDGRAAPVIVYNTCDHEIRVTLWYPDDFNPYYTWIIPANSEIVLKVKNNTFNAGSDWGVEIENNHFAVCTLREVSNWTQSSYGNRWCLYIGLPPGYAW